MTEILTVSTNGPGLYEITASVARAVRDRGEGLVTLFVRHTSCSLLVQENADPSVQVDLESFFELLVPSGDDPKMQWLSHTSEGPDDMPAHIKASMMPVSISIPVSEGRLVLGQWQGIYLFEHRKQTQKRQVAVQITS